MKSPKLALLLLTLLAACTPTPPTKTTIADPEPTTRQRADRDEAQVVGDHNEGAWRQLLKSPANADLLARAQSHEQLLTNQGDYHPAPRFTQTLAITGDSALRLSRPQLLANLQRQLAPLQHIHREPSSPNAPDDTPETLAAAEKNLSRCDLLNLQLLLHWLAQPATTAQILALGTADHTDTSTEFGGLLTPIPTTPTSLQLIPMPPMLSFSDAAYITSDATIARVPTSLALFHFHFHQLDNAENAGPGIGDLTFARTNRTTCLVFTSLSPTSFDADYYNPDGAVVDLGVYHVTN